jgi:hypothetical protein
MREKSYITMNLSINFVKHLRKMKNLDLNAMSGQEMNVGEMKNVDGGSLFAAVCITLAILYIAETCCGLAQEHKFNGQP